MPSILRVQNLTKSYQSGNRALTVLDNVSFELQAGDTFSIVGSIRKWENYAFGLMCRFG
jgi:putative ABC transport system ATP-binding protein